MFLITVIRSYCDRAASRVGIRLVHDMITYLIVQDDYVGFDTGNGEKLSYSQAACLAWLCLAVA